MSAKDMYADLEKIEARGKRKKDKRKGFFSRNKKKDAVEPEPVVQSEPLIQPAKEPVPEPEEVEEEVFEEVNDMNLEQPPEPQSEPDDVPESPAPNSVTPEPPEAMTPPEPEESIQTNSAVPDDPMNMLEFSESTDEPESPAQTPGTDPFGQSEDPAGFSSMPASPEPEEIVKPEEPAQVISLEEQIPEPANSSPPQIIEPDNEPVTAPVEQQVQTPAPAPISEPIPDPTTPPVTVPVEQPVPVQAAPSPESVKPGWAPLTGKALAHAEAHIHEYKLWLNKKYKAGKFTKDECSHKLRHKEVEIGLRPPQ